SIETGSDRPSASLSGSSRTQVKNASANAAAARPFQPVRGDAVVAMFMFSEPKRRAVARAPLSWHLNGAGRSLLAGPHGARKVDDRDTNGVAVFGPGAVIVADVVAEQLLQGEPGVARALADPA